MKNQYNKPCVLLTEMEQDDLIATSSYAPKVGSGSTDDSAQLGNGRDGNPIWD